MRDFSHIAGGDVHRSPQPVNVAQRGCHLRQDRLALDSLSLSGNLGGFAAPFAVGWLTDLTKRPAYGLYLMAAIMVLGGLLVLIFVPRKLPGDNV